MELRNNAVSPVVAVILMVAITVILSAVIGTFVLDLGQSATDGRQSDIGVQFGSDSGNTTATIITGTADELKLLVNGTEVDNVTNASPGDVLSASAPPGSRITVVSVSDGDRSVVTTTTRSTDVGTGTSLSAPSDGLVAYWKLNGDANDSVGSHDGTVNGATPYSDSNRGDVYSFDGNDDISVSDSSDLEPSQVTVSYWMYWSGTVPDTYYPRPLAKQGTYSWQINKGSSFQMVFKVGGKNYYVKGPVPAANEWVHVVGTFNGSVAKLYVNGSVVASNSSMSGSLDASSNNLLFGDDSTGGNNFKGRLDSIRVYNRSLNASEVQDLYAAEK